MLQSTALKFSMIAILSVFLGGCTPKLSFDKSPSGLKIDTIPTAKVYLNDKEVGETPFHNQNITAGDYLLKLVPQATDSATLLSWESNLTLAPQTTTIITRTFAPSDLDVEGAVIQLQPDSRDKALFSVISDPDSVNISIDGKPYGYTPLSKIELTPGDHALVLSAPGFKPQSLTVNLASSFNLLLSSKLAGISYAQVALSPPTPSPSQTPPQSSTPSASLAPTVPKPYIIILDTPDTQTLKGLNVRAEGSASSSPLGLARIGEKLPYVSSNDTGWHQVTFENKVGWVSGKYTTIVK